MNAVKQEILRKMDSFPCPVRICCVKFLQRVVQVQTPGLIADPRVCSASSVPPPGPYIHHTKVHKRPDQNETSLAVVPRNHALLAIPHLEAEASGLLDRLLGVFQEETRFEAGD
jgi:symplekin